MAGLLGMAAQSAWAVPIDEFDVEQGGGGALSTATSNPISGTASNGGTIIGDEREVFVIKTDGENDVSVNIFSNGDTIYTHSQGSGTVGRSVTTWDGTDGDTWDTADDTASLACSGANSGLDLDLSGATTIDVDMVRSDLADGDVIIRLYSNADGGAIESQESTQTISSGQTSGALLQYNVSDFSPPVDLSNVCAIQFEVDGTGVERLDIDFDRITVNIPEPELTCNSLNFEGAPSEPGSGDMWNSNVVLGVPSDSGESVDNLGVTVSCSSNLNLAGPGLNGDCTTTGAGSSEVEVDCSNGPSIAPGGTLDLDFETTATTDISGSASCSVTALSGQGTATDTEANIQQFSCSDSLSVQPPPPPVPALTAWGLGSLLVLLPSAAGYISRRRRH